MEARFEFLARKRLEHLGGLIGVLFDAARGNAADGED
jgi:hypothetical protein